MSDAGRVALVSGANRGLGLEISRQLIDRGLRVVMGARDLGKGETAAASVGEHALACQLDVADAESIARLAESLDRDFGRVDVLVNNAGILIDTRERAVAPDFDRVEQTLEVNTLGAWRLAAAVLPLMQRGGYGRIVNVSTGMAQLTDMGGGSPGYRASKTALNAVTRMLSAELRGSGILVNSMCPGWVQTDMGGRSAPRTLEEGADTAVWLATLPGDGPTGGFFRDRQPIPW